MTGTLGTADVFPIALPTPFLVGPVNAYLVRGDRLTLIDTGPATDSAYETLVAGLRAHHVQPSDLEAILVTHGHVDHVGNLARLVEESGATAYGHDSAAVRPEDWDAKEQRSHEFILASLKSFGAPQSILDATTQTRAGFKSMASHVPLDHLLEHEDRALEFSVHHVPGHSASDTLYVNDASGIAFTGDHLLRRVSPTPLLRAAEDGKSRARSLLEYQKSLAYTRALPITTCYPGHGEPFTSHAAVIDRWLARLEKRTAKVLEFLNDGPLTPMDVCSRLYPDLNSETVYIGLAVAIGHLDVLEVRGHVTCHQTNGVLRYEVVKETIDKRQTP